MTNFLVNDDSIQDKLLIFLNEVIIGSRQASRILSDLHLLHTTPGNVTQKLKAILKKQPAKTIRHSVKRLLADASTNCHCGDMLEATLFNDVVLSHIAVMQQNLRFEPDLSGNQ